MDADTANGLVVFAEEARAAMRRGDASATDSLNSRYSEIRQALDWYLDAGRADDAFRLAAALVPLWMATSRATEAIAWFDRALARPGEASARRARALHDHGYLAFFSGGYELAERQFEASRAMAVLIDDRDLAALALAGAARVTLNTDPARSVELTREAMALTDDLPDGTGRSSAQHVLGVSLQLAGDLEGAREVMSARLAHARATGNEYVGFVESSNLSMVERKLGNLERAEELALDAVRYTAREHDVMATAWTINGLAAVTAAQGRYQRAARLLGIADALLERAGGEWPADEREQHDTTARTLAGALSESDLKQARGEGAAMSFEAAMEFALARTVS
jgi:non-specific serine/threonine protein kinase